MTQTTADTTYGYNVKISNGMVVAGVWRSYSYNGKSSSMSSEAAKLTPNQARLYAAELISAANQAESAENV